jgi:hypothetical protein
MQSLADVRLDLILPAEAALAFVAEATRRDGLGAVAWFDVVAARTLGRMGCEPALVRALCATFADAHWEGRYRFFAARNDFAADSDCTGGAASDASTTVSRSCGRNTRRSCSARSSRARSRSPMSCASWGSRPTVATIA